MILERMAMELDLSATFLQNIALGASHEYKSYGIPKRSGGMRVIHQPSRRLKALQRWLLHNVITTLPVHAAAKAYRSGLSTKDNALAHVDSRFLLRMDLSSFFESITSQDLRNYIGLHPQLFQGWTDVDVNFFCRIVCRNGALTVGAPSSPALSNAACFKLDNALSSYCAEKQVTYTRYADDLFFSTVQANVLRSVEDHVSSLAVTLDIPAGLRVNKAKTRHSSRRRTRRITGLVIGSDRKVYIGRQLKRKIRAMIFNRATLTTEARASLSGLISYTRGPDPDFVNSLITKYGYEVVQDAMHPPKTKSI